MKNKRLEVYTLGKFLVRKENMILSEKNKRSEKLWHLFQYLLSKPYQYIPVEILIEEINLPLELIDAKNALENIVYRLRKLLAADEKYQADKYIIFNRGGYSFNWDEDHFLDFREFNFCFQKGKELYQSQNYQQCLDLFNQCSQLYKGKYLAENTNYPWLLQQRMYYQEMFIEQAHLSCQIFMQKNKYNDLKNLCRTLLQIEPFEEKFHSYYIKSLLLEKQQQQAQNHFEYVRTLFSGSRQTLSADFLNLLNNDLSKNDNYQDDSSYYKKEENIKQIIDEVNNYRVHQNDLFFINPEAFKLLLNLEHRKKERSGQPLFLISLSLPSASIPKDSQQKKALFKQLELIFLNTIRKSDVITRWGKYQYLILLSNLDEIKVQEIIKRIKFKFFQLKMPGSIFLNSDYKKL